MKLTPGLRSKNLPVTIDIPSSVRAADLAPFVSDLASLSAEMVTQIGEAEEYLHLNLEVLAGYVGLEKKCINTADQLNGGGLKAYPLGDLDFDEYEASREKLIGGLRRNMSAIHHAFAYYLQQDRNVFRADHRVANPFDKPLRVAINKARTQAEMIGRYEKWKRVARDRQDASFAGNT